MLELSTRPNGLHVRKPEPTAFEIVDESLPKHSVGSWVAWKEGQGRAQGVGRGVCECVVGVGFE